MNRPDLPQFCLKHFRRVFTDMLRTPKTKASSFLGTRRSMSATGSISRFKPSFDPCEYSHGRWLDRNNERQQARKLEFNFGALLDLAVDRSPGATEVVGCDKKEGGFNRVFVIQLDNGKSVVARLPSSRATYGTCAISSEVATLQFIKETTSVPVPEILSWSSSNTNAIGTGYILMSEMSGVLFKDVWKNMTASQHIKCIQSIARLIKQLCAIQLPCYGSIYHVSEGSEDAVYINDRFVIGPIARSHRCPTELSQDTSVAGCEPPSGPWHNLETYFRDLFESARFYGTAACSESNEIPASTVTQQELLRHAQEIIEMVTSQEVVRCAGAPLLSHPDLHTRNIFVNPDAPTEVTGIIDWESATVEPAFVFAAETPDFAAELPDDHATRQIISSEEDDQISACARLKADVDFCVRTWSLVPMICEKLREASVLDNTLIQLLAAPSNGWLADEDFLRPALSDITQKWEDLGLPGRGSYQESPAEAETLRARLDETRATQQLKEYLSRRLGCDIDGWVP